MMNKSMYIFRPLKSGKFLSLCYANMPVDMNSFSKFLLVTVKLTLSSCLLDNEYECELLHHRMLIYSLRSVNMGPLSNCVKRWIQHHSAMGHDLSKLELCILLMACKTVKQLYVDLWLVDIGKIRVLHRNC